MKGCIPLSDEEVKEIANSFSGAYVYRERAWFILGCKTGFRVSEILSLKLQDVCQSGKITNQVTVQKRHMKKKTESRTVALHPLAKEALKKWINQLKSFTEGEKDVYLFRSQKGNKPISRTHAWRVLKRAIKANEISGKTGTHSMRKTFAQNVHKHFLGELAKGKPVDPLRMTGKALGHRNINNTDKYLSFLESDIENAILAI
jgi:site-specific recombinase XerD